MWLRRKSVNRDSPCGRDGRVDLPMLNSPWILKDRRAASACSDLNHLSRFLCYLLAFAETCSKERNSGSGQATLRESLRPNLGFGIYEYNPFRNIFCFNEWGEAMVSPLPEFAGYAAFIGT